MMKIKNAAKFAVMYIILIMLILTLCGAQDSIQSYMYRVNPDFMLYYYFVLLIYFLTASVIFIFLFVFTRTASKMEMKHRSLFYVLNGLGLMALIFVYNRYFYFFTGLPQSGLLAARFMMMPAAALIGFGVLAKFRAGMKL